MLGLCVVLAIGAEAVYPLSRVLRTMAHQRLIPEPLAHVDDRGRPRLALLNTSAIVAILPFIQLTCMWTAFVFGILLIF